MGAVAIGEVNGVTGVQIFHRYDVMAPIALDTRAFGLARRKRALQGAAVAVVPLAGAPRVVLGVVLFVEPVARRVAPGCDGTDACAHEGGDEGDQGGGAEGLHSGDGFFG